MDKDLGGSGVGVLDKAIAILNALESGPHSLAELVAATGIARPTAHRLAVALEHHRFVARDLHGRFTIGAREEELAASAGEDRLMAIANPALVALRDATGESAQIYRRHSDTRLCIAAAERLSGLRDSVPVGTALTMQAGSAAQILLAWEDVDRLHRALKIPDLTPQLYPLFDVEVGRKVLVSVKLELPVSLHQFVDHTIE